MAGRRTAGLVLAAVCGVAVGTHAVPGSAQTTTSSDALIRQTARWVVTSAQRPSGAITTGDRIVPYFANLTALGLVHDSAAHGAVRAWMAWYFQHLNYPDRWGLVGTVYDYRVTADGEELSIEDADSTDSYAASFLTLARAYYEAGAPDARAFLEVHAQELALIGEVIVQTKQPDGLTWAKPSHRVKYLMDNVEAYRGLRDLAWLLEAFGDVRRRVYFEAQAGQIRSGIEQVLWNPSDRTYYPSIDASGRKAPMRWNVWYPDATSQLFPVVVGLIDPTGPRAASLYRKFSEQFPGWPTLDKPDPFPWAVVAYAAALHRDSARVSAYARSIQTTYQSRGWPWPWYSAEAGWFIRALAEPGAP